jgi:cell division septal protein FtsQ
MEQLYGAMNAPPPLPPSRRRGVRALLAGVILVVVLGILGVGSVLAASPSPSAAASGSPAPGHVCDRNKSSSSS